ncbi:MAG: glucosamine-6-phosphate deaminase [Actinomycetia bacterium]|nr:glucosamine-6-phosphate deaminase [Actinomycetes bacterium]
MEIIICPDAERVGEVAAAVVARVAVAVGPSVVLGVATGSSPLALYENLAKRVAAGTLDLSDAQAFALDEYVGLPAGHPESYAEVIRRTVTEPLKLDPARVHVPDGRSEGLSGAGQRYEDAIAAAGGVDVQILGVGANGHIGFNEPGSSLASRTRVKTLSQRTRDDNARFFDSVDQVPTHCITQGIGTILAARHLVLVATGAAKADAVVGLVEGPVTSMCPASALQLHRFATVVCDEPAAAKLALADYYRQCFDEQLDWQKLDV